MSKILSPVDWLEENREKYPNGTIASKIMEGYAEYYYCEKQEENKQMQKDV